MLSNTFLFLGGCLFVLLGIAFCCTENYDRQHHKRCRRNAETWRQMVYNTTSAEQLQVLVQNIANDKHELKTFLPAKYVDKHFAQVDFAVRVNRDLLELINKESG
jgi:hypothetical protein